MKEQTMKNKLIAIMIAVTATTAFAETKHTDLCRQARVEMSADDYYRIRGLMPRHDVTLSREGRAYLEFGTLDYPQTTILQQRLQYYGGLKCTNTAEWYKQNQAIVTHKVGNGYIDCVISDFGKAMPEQPSPIINCLPIRYQ